MTRIITPSELQKLSRQELHVLFRKVSEQAAQDAPGSGDQQKSLKNLEQIARTLRTRPPSGPKPPGF